MYQPLSGIIFSSPPTPSGDYFFSSPPTPSGIFFRVRQLLQGFFSDASTASGIIFSSPTPSGVPDSLGPSITLEFSRYDENFF